MADFNTYENSKRASHAIYLYKFVQGSTEWRYLSGSETNMSFGGSDYTPAVITHSAINQSQNPYDDKIEIETKTNLSIVTDNIGAFQSSKIYLTIYKIQNNDPTLYKTLWYGYVSDFVYNDQTTKIMIESIMAALNKRVVKNIFSYQCRHILFGSACGLVESANKTDGVITSISGTSIGATEFNTGTPDNFLSSMIVTSAGEKRVIVEDPGSGVVKIMRPFKSAIVTTTFYVTHRCDRTMTGLCATKSNTDNFGGFEFIKNNPFEGITQDSAAILTNPISET